MPNPVEIWKNEKHGFDVWSDVLRYAGGKTPMAEISDPDLERMKWHGFFYRKRDGNGRYMNRIRITGSELTADQAKEIAYIAYEYGHGIVDVTTRANIQIQGIEIEHVPQVVARLERVGLTSKQTGHDNIRNVFAHPYSGLLPDELIRYASPLSRDHGAVSRQPGILGSAAEVQHLPQRDRTAFSPFLVAGFEFSGLSRRGE